MTEMISALLKHLMNQWIWVMSEFQGLSTAMNFFKILLQNVNKPNFYYLYNYEWLKYTANSFKQIFWVAIFNIH